jgi:hypothetical protein
MGRASLRRAAVALTAALVLAVTFSPDAHAADVGLTAVMLDTGDLPAGFTPDASLTGPLTGQRAQDLGLSPGRVGPQGTWVRTWLAADGAAVIETAVDAGTGDTARAGAASEVSVLQKEGATSQPVTGFDVYGGYVGRYFELVLPLARGPYLFGLHVLEPTSSAGSADRLMSELGTAQVRKVPADTPDTAPASDAYRAAAAVVGALIAYLLLAGGVGYLRNPLRRKLWRPRSRPVRPELAGHGVVGGAVDVSAAARRSTRIAVGRLAVQLAGLGLVAYAADVFQVRFWYAYLAAGLAVVWAGGRFIRPAGAGRGSNGAIMAGSHRILVTVMRIVASVMILIGLAAIMSFGLYQAQPPAATVQGLPGLVVPSLGLPRLDLPGLGLSWQGTTTMQNLATDLEWTGLGLLVLGAVIFCVARRLGSVDARRLMLSDPRPPVLYLRSSGDDRLRLWTATLGSSSLVERFTFRRLDRFEEVLIRYLSRYGPVIAVHPPGSRLAPLRAARETIDSADWHSAVANWMARSALIVFLAPPDRVTQGRQWELRTVGEHDRWDRALIVVPPVPAEQLKARWRAFGAACAGLWPFTVAGPVADPGTLMLAFRHGRWDVTTADQRTEWSYAAALERVLGDPARLAAPGTRGPRLGAWRGPLTLPVAALIIMVAAVMAGAGTWYAVDQAPASHLSAVAKHSGSPPLAPSSSSLQDGSVSDSLVQFSALASAPPSTAPPSSAPPSTAPPSTAPPSTAPPSTAPPSTAPPSTAPPSSAPPTTAAVGAASLAPAAARYPGATAIQAIISQYFQAINSRNYAAYLATLSPGNAPAARHFQIGFQSSRDSDVLVTGITTAPDGRPAADVTFTSRQRPQDGPEGESCTNWHVTMYFDGSAGTYTIGAPPNGYKAAYQACPA